MVFSLVDILENPGAVLRFDYTTSFADLEINFQFPFKSSARVHGEFRNEAGVLVLDAVCDTVMDYDCSRCADHVSTDYSLPIEATLSEELEDPNDIANADVLLIENASIDLDEAVREALILESDMVFLCSPDCKGICPQCGTNLNHGECGCKPEVDPRLAKLAELLEQRRQSGEDN